MADAEDLAGEAGEAGAQGEIVALKGGGPDGVGIGTVRPCRVTRLRSGLAAPSREAAAADGAAACPGGGGARSARTRTRSCGISRNCISAPR